MLYSHDGSNDNNNDNTCWLSFLIWTGLFLSAFSPWWLEEKDTILRAYAKQYFADPYTYTRTTHLVVSKISTHLCRTKPKLIWSDQIKFFSSDQMRKPRLPSFQNLKILGTSLPDMTSATHTIHSNCASSSIFCLGVYYDRWSFPCVRACGCTVWLRHLNQRHRACRCTVWLRHLNQRHRVVQSPTKTKW